MKDITQKGLKKKWRKTKIVLRNNERQSKKHLWYYDSFNTEI
jgi:hypothetical protein